MLKVAKKCLKGRDMTNRVFFLKKYPPSLDFPFPDVSGAFANWYCEYNVRLYLCKWEGEIKCVGGETGRDVTLVGHSCPACMSHRLLLNHRHHLLIVTIVSGLDYIVRVSWSGLPRYIAISAELFSKQSIGQKYSRSSRSAANNKRGEWQMGSSWLALYSCYSKLAYTASVQCNFSWGYFFSSLNTKLPWIL